MISPRDKAYPSHGNLCDDCGRPLERCAENPAQCRAYVRATCLRWFILDTHVEVLRPIGAPRAKFAMIYRERRHQWYYEVNKVRSEKVFESRMDAKRAVVTKLCLDAVVPFLPLDVTAK